MKPPFAQVANKTSAQSGKKHPQAEANLWLQLGAVGSSSCVHRHRDHRPPTPSYNVPPPPPTMSPPPPPKLFCRRPNKQKTVSLLCQASPREQKQLKKPENIFKKIKNSSWKKQKNKFKNQEKVEATFCSKTLPKTGCPYLDGRKNPV